MHSIFIIYYVQTNLICMLFMGFVFHSYVRESRGLTESKWFLASLLTVQVYCVSDIFAAVFKNSTAPGAGMILWLANTVYITIPLILIVFWNKYIIEHTRTYYTPGKALKFLDRTLPLISLLFILIAFSTPLTHSIFYLDEKNGYHRTIGAYLVPLFAYIFMLYETVKLQIIRRSSDSLQVKHDANLLSLFVIPCILFSGIQVAVYGITASQVGFTMAVLMVFLGRQRNKISRDELTGINNRREYEYAVDRLTRSSGTVMVLMADVDNFKRINDTYGHIEGDAAIRGAAMILRNACSNRKELGSVSLYRYGGDEFIMLSTELNALSVRDQLLESIARETEKWNSVSEKAYTLSLSTGIACGSYSGRDIMDLINAADREMYQNKNSKKKHG